MKPAEERIKKYAYYPANPKALTLQSVIHKMRDFRFLYVFTIPIWIFWGAGALAGIYCLFADLGRTKTRDDYAFLLIYNLVIIVLFFVNIGAYKLIHWKLKNKDVASILLNNTKQYLPQANQDLMGLVERDFANGLPFLKSHNLAVSNHFIIGSLNLNTLNPVVIPKEEVREVAYEIYEGDLRIIPSGRGVTMTRDIVQNFNFRLNNGQSVPVQVNDKYNPDLALYALQRAGLKTVNLR